MSAMRVLLFIAAIGLIPMGCREATSPVKLAEPEKPEKAVEGPFDKDLMKIAVEYKIWGRVDDHVRWGPAYCTGTDPAQVSFSISKDELTHGQKLYSLFARDHKEYISIRDIKQVGIGQVIVKQSWKPKEITNSKVFPDRDSAEKGTISQYPYDALCPYIKRDGKIFEAVSQLDLFIMMKLDPKTPGTDEGWVYATVTPDGKKVTAAGRIESCMKCHQEAKHDRLFGLRE